MSSIYWILPVLLGLIPSCSSLSCMKCGTTRATSCNSTSYPCLPGSACLATYTLFETGEDDWALYTLTCGSKYACGLTGTGRLPVHGNLRMATSCCTTNNCIPKLPSFPKVSSTWNGVVCPSCVDPYSTSCTAKETMECRGNETMCYFKSTHVPGMVSTASRGCATKTLCDIFGRSPVIGGPKGMRFTCTSGSISLKSSL